MKDDAEIRLRMAMELVLKFMDTTLEEFNVNTCVFMKSFLLEILEQQIDNDHGDCAAKILLAGRDHVLAYRKQKENAN